MSSLREELRKSTLRFEAVKYIHHVSGERRDFLDNWLGKETLVDLRHDLGVDTYVGYITLLLEDKEFGLLIEKAETTMLGYIRKDSSKMPFSSGYNIQTIFATFEADVLMAFEMIKLGVKKSHDAKVRVLRYLTSRLVEINKLPSPPTDAEPNDLFRFIQGRINFYLDTLKELQKQYLCQ